MIKTLLFSQNEGDLKKILQLVNSLLKDSDVINGIKRIQKVNNISPIYLLDDILKRRNEIKNLKFDEKKTFFTRVPLCIIPGYEHLSTDLNYNLRASLVIANFEDKKYISNMHNIISDFLSDPFKEVCVKCSLLGLCPMGSSSFDLKPFYPYESQRPIPFKKDVRKIIKKIAKDEDEFDKMYKNYLLLNSWLKAEFEKIK